jgi:alkanesulfonate monooxygenase SsuD/methylene tetrahydromethanopterin reductase-like flavin-dependent oxidoreductase (luciferase family)
LRAVKIGIMLPMHEGDGGIARWSTLSELAQATEAQGLDSVWLADHLLYQPPEGEAKGMHEAWTLMSALAAVTERVEIAPLVLCASFRNPGLVANMAATLDLVANGRLTLGVGAGWHDPEYEAFGFPADRKVSRFEEWVEIVARLLRGEQVTFDGTYYSTKNAVLVPAPERKIPLLVASHQPRMHGLTAKWADSWNTAWYGLPDDRFRERVEGMDAALAAAGRDPADLERTVGIIMVDPDEPDEEDRAAYPGTTEEIAAALGEYERLGFAHAIMFPQPATVASVERVAEAVRLSRG